MTDSTMLMAVFGLVFVLNLAACPDSKPSDNNDDAAGDGQPPQSTETGTAKPAAAAGDGDGDPGSSCEAELERVKAELAACEAPK